MTDVREPDPSLPSLADRLNEVISTIHARDEAPLTNDAIASAASAAHVDPISADYVAQLRSGVLKDAPESHIDAIAGVVNIPTRYFVSTDVEYVKSVSRDLTNLRLLRDVGQTPSS